MKYIVELRKIDYGTVQVEAENKIEAIDKALDMTEGEDMEWNMDEICSVGVYTVQEVMQ